MKKIILGMVTVGVMAMGAEIKQVVRHTLEHFNATGKDATSTNKVDRKTTEWYEPVFGNSGKVVIKQTKNPCLFITKEYWEESKGKKLNSNTVEWTKQGGGRIPFGFYDVDRPDLNHLLVFKDNGKIAIGMNGSADSSILKFVGKEVIQILGTSKNCYLKPTTEEWYIYYEYPEHPEYPADKLHLKGKVTFYLE